MNHIDQYDEREAARMFTKFERELSSPHRRQKRIGWGLILTGCGCLVGLKYAMDASWWNTIEAGLVMGLMLTLFMGGARGKG